MAVAFGNVSGTDFNATGVASTADAQVTKPTATVDGTLQLIFGTIRSLTAGTHLITNFADEAVIASENSSTLLQAGALWRLGLTADGATVNYNHSNAAAVEKSALVMVLTGHNAASPIRAFGTPVGGNGTSAVSPDTSAATAGDLIVRGLIWYDDGDGLTITHPGSHTAIAADFRHASAGGAGIAVSFATAAGGAPGTAAWTLPSARDYVAFTVVIATAAGGTVNTETLTDTITASDSAARFAIRGNVSTDNITLADAVFWWWYRTRVMTDNLVITEGATETSTVSNVHAIDEITVSDGIVAWLRRTRLAQDAIAITDEAIASTIGYLIFVSVLTSQLTITDQALTTRYFSRLLESGVLTSDQALRALLVTRNLLDTIDVEDQGLTALQRFILLTDAISLDDSLASVVVTPTVPGVTNPRILIGFDQPRIELGGYGF